MGPCSFTGNTTLGTGGIVDYNNFHWNATGSTWPRLGLTCDTGMETWSITSVNATSIMFIPSSAFAIGRIWAPDQTAGISYVTNGTAVWDPVFAVLTVTPDGAGRVVVTWNPMGATPGAPSGVVQGAAISASQLLVIVMIVTLLKKPEEWRIIIGATVMLIVVLILAGLLYNLGF
jgi:hypothetical protein